MAFTSGQQAQRGQTLQLHGGQCPTATPDERMTVLSYLSALSCILESLKLPCAGTFSIHRCWLSRVPQARVAACNRLLKPCALRQLKTFAAASEQVNEGVASSSGGPAAPAPEAHQVQERRRWHIGEQLSLSVVLVTSVYVVV